MVNWILEEGVFGGSLTTLVTEIRQQGHNVKIIDYTRGLTDYQQFFPQTECAIFYGSLYIAERILSCNESWKPEIIGTIENYHCTAYYPHLKPWLLNAEGYILPLSELSASIAENPKLLFNLEESKRLFLRPNSPLKPFAGGLYSHREIADLESFMKRHYLEDPNMLVVVAPEKSIAAEWRSIIAKGQILCASQYRQFEKPYYQSGMPDVVRQVAEAVAKQQWQPDRIWVLDLCCSNNLAYVLEINFLSCSALYQCNLSLVVKEASEVGWKQWIQKQQRI
ncbi:MAG: ATP-grasp domain-containing protein [Microcoleus sp.]